MRARKAPEVETTEETLNIEQATEQAPVVRDGIMKCVDQLAQVIGARPAGTEEEQQASFFIENLLKEEAGLQTETEEFNCNPNYELPKMICCIASAVLAILTIFLPLTIVPALLLTLIFAVLFVLETFGISPLTNINKKGISQNIVAKYVPGSSEGAEVKTSSRRKRKIIFVAHYDTGKVRAELKGPLFSALNIIHWVELVCMVIIPIVLIIRFASNASDVLLTVLNVIIIIAAIGAFLPVISFILHQTAQYNNGANCNASGIAVMAEVARRVGREIPAMVAESDDVVMNGEAAIRESGLLPDGARLSYSDDLNSHADVLNAGGNADGNTEGSTQLGEDHVAKASGAGVDAIFEGIGKSYGSSSDSNVASSMASNVASSMAGDSINIANPALEAVPTSASVPSTSIPVTSVSVAPNANSASMVGAAGAIDMPDVIGAQTPVVASKPENDNVPEWFKRGREAANQHKPKESHGPTIVQRSRFADALDAAAASTAEAAEQAARERQQTPSIAEQRLQQMRESIMDQAAGAQNALRKNTHEDANVGVGVQAAGVGAGAGMQVAGAQAMGTQVADPQSQAAQAQASQTQSSAAQPADVTASGMGVDGYLSTTLDSPNYATAAAQEAAAAAKAADIAASVSAEATVASAAAASLASDAAQLAAQASQDQANQNRLEAEQRAAVANRTISFIPVAVDQNEIFKENEALKNQAGGSAQTAGAAGNVSNAGLANAAGSNQQNSDQPNVQPNTQPNAGQPLNAGQQSGQPSGAQGDHKNARKRREIALPSLTGAIEGVKARLQDAPIDEQNGSSKSEDEIRAERLARQERLSVSLPSTSKASKAGYSKSSTAGNSVQIDEKLSSSETGNINIKAGAFIDASATSSFEPVGDELISNMSADEVYVEDADDSDYVEQITHTGALAGPGYVQMPSSRASRVFGKFRKNKKKDKDVSLKDSLGLDDDFDAREVGKARGGWESFRDDSADSFDDFEDDWNGGAFSKLKQNAAEGLNRVRGRSDGRANDVDAGGYADDYIDDGYGYADGYDVDGYDADGYVDDYANGYDNGYDYGYEDSYGDGAYAESYGDGYSDDPYTDPYADPYVEEMVDQDDPVDQSSQSGRSSGGVLGGLRSKLGKVGRSSGDGDEDGVNGSGRFAGAGSGRTSRASRSSRGADDGARVRTRKPVANPFGDLPIDFTDTQSKEREAIQQFKNGAINTEIWFVALGAELADNSGIKAFLADHSEELHGSVVIDLNGLGTGTLSVIDQEGMFRPIKASSRLKRYANRAASSLGLKLGKAQMLWRDSAACISARKGYQTLHLAGVMNGKPAYSAEADDQVENISEETLLQNADFVMELIHNI